MLFVRLRRAILGLLVALLPAAAQQNVLTWKYNKARTGVNRAETTLTLANVNTKTFGRLFSIKTAGKPDPQVLYVAGLAIPGNGTHNTLFVEDEQDMLYAFDADTGVQLWKTSALPAGEVPSDDRGVGSVTPTIGITATPVIDLKMGPHGTLYAVAMSKDSNGDGVYHHRLHAIDITTGQEQFGGPVEIQATCPGSGRNAVNGQLVFGAAQLKEQAALTLLDGMVLTAWSSQDDTPPYNGWLLGYDESTLAKTQVLCLTPNGVRGSIWGSRGGPAVAADGSIYAAVANGTFDTTLDVNGFPSLQDYGNGLLKIQMVSGKLQIVDYYTMSNNFYEVNHDLDLGSTPAILLPPLKDSEGVTRNLVIGAGKDQSIYVADTSNLGKFHTPDQIYQKLPLALNGLAYNSPVFYNGHLYITSQFDFIRVFQFQNGKFNSTPVALSPFALEKEGSHLIVSSNGNSDAILWAIEDKRSIGQNVLHAFDAVHFVNGQLVELWNSTQAANGHDKLGGVNHFVTPLVVNGKVYAASWNEIVAYGLTQP